MAFSQGGGTGSEKYGKSFNMKVWYQCVQQRDRLKKRLKPPTIYHRKFSSPFPIENDHWLHARSFTSFMNFMFDFGPGVAEVSAWDFNGDNKVGSGTVSYFLLKTQFTVFWKLVGEGIGKYAINASEKRLGLYATERLPEDDLNEPATLAMPEDSFLGSMFFGVKDLFFGIGAGWRYNIQVLNVAEKDDTKRETTKNHGLGLYYEVRL
jgi:hypothetical protein